MKQYRFEVRGYLNVYLWLGTVVEVMAEKIEDAVKEAFKKANTIYPKKDFPDGVTVKSK